MDNLTPEQEKIDKEATGAVTLRGIYPTRPGYCAAFARIVMTRTLGLERAWGPGPDAKEVGRILIARVGEVSRKRGSAIGDLLIWDGPGHGEHGHIAIRVTGNRVAENSRYHSHDGSDARGFRSLDSLDPNYRIVRLWR